MTDTSNYAISPDFCMTKPETIGGCRVIQQYWPYALLISICLPVFLTNTFFRELWAPDEPRYAQVAREMVETGQFVVPHYNGEVYADKPPLLFWMIALSSIMLGGFGTFSVVLPTALAGTAAVLLTYRLAYSMFGDRRVGLLVGFVLMTSQEFMFLSTTGRMDIPLTFFITLATYCLWQWYVSGKNSHLVLFYLGMALGCLVKGPVGLFPLLTAVVFLAIGKEAARIGKLRIGIGFAGMIALVACWLLPAALAGGEAYWQELLGDQIFGRVVNSWSKKQPFYYYFTNFPLGFMPWFLFLPVAALQAFRGGRKFFDKRDLFLTVWFVSFFVVFSCISGKRSVYILPLYPSAAIFIARRLIEAAGGGVGKKTITAWRAGFVTLFGTIFACGAVVALFADVFAGFERQCLAAGIVCAGCALVGIHVACRAVMTKTSMTLIGALVIVVLLGTFIGVPYMNRYKSALPLAKCVKDLRRGNERIALYDFASVEIQYYLGINVERISNGPELIRYMKSPEGAICVMNIRDYSTMESNFAQGTERIGEFRVGRRRFGVFFNPPGDQ